MNKHITQSRILAPDGGLQRLRCTDGGDFSPMHNANPAAETLSLLHRVGGEKNGHIAASLQLQEMIPDGLARDGIESNRWLI